MALNVDKNTLDPRKRPTFDTLLGGEDANSVFKRGFYLYRQTNYFAASDDKPLARIKNKNLGLTVHYTLYYNRIVNVIL